jgi:adenine-specific DNA methylase
MITVEDLTFLKEVVNELSVNAEDYDFGPSYSLAKDRQKLALIKLNRMIREIKNDTNRL